MNENVNLKISNNLVYSLFNWSIRTIIEDKLNLSITKFSSIKRILRLVLREKSNSGIRAIYKEEGIYVPPLMMATITADITINNRRLNYNVIDELSSEEWGDIFRQASELGIQMITLDGEEPLNRKDVIIECGKYPEVLFLIYTKGLLINKEWLDFFSIFKNVIPIICIDHEADEIMKIGSINRREILFELLNAREILNITCKEFNYRDLSEIFGRAAIHVNPYGKIDECTFTNLRYTSLKKALSENIFGLTRI